MMVWCALGKNGIFGPYFFENDGGHWLTECTPILRNASEILHSGIKEAEGF